MGGAKIGKGPAKGIGKGPAGNVSAGPGNGSPASEVPTVPVRRNREEHVQRISELVMLGRWMPGSSTREYAATHGYSYDTIAEYSGEASRRVSAAIADVPGFRENLVTSMLGIAQVAKEEFHGTRDPQMGALANTGYGRLLTSFEVASGAKTSRANIDNGAGLYESKSIAAKIAQTKAWMQICADELVLLEERQRNGEP